MQHEQKGRQVLKLLRAVWLERRKLVAVLKLKKNVWEKKIIF